MPFSPFSQSNEVGKGFPEKMGKTFTKSCLLRLDEKVQDADITDLSGSLIDTVEPSSQDRPI